MQHFSNLNIGETLKYKRFELKILIVAANLDLEKKHQQLVDERDQILAVISQKTKENRQLKDENQKLLDAVSAGQNALAKV